MPNFVINFVCLSHSPLFLSISPSFPLPLHSSFSPSTPPLSLSLFTFPFLFVQLSYAYIYMLICGYFNFLFLFSQLFFIFICFYHCYFVHIVKQFVCIIELLLWNLFQYICNGLRYPEWVVEYINKLSNFSNFQTFQDVRVHSTTHTVIMKVDARFVDTFRDTVAMHYVTVLTFSQCAPRCPTSYT